MDEITNLIYYLKRINSDISDKRGLDATITLLKDASDDLSSIIKKLEKQYNEYTE